MQDHGRPKKKSWTLETNSPKERNKDMGCELDLWANPLLWLFLGLRVEVEEPNYHAGRNQQCPQSNKIVNYFIRLLDI